MLTEPAAPREFLTEDSVAAGMHAACASLAIRVKAGAGAGAVPRWLYPVLAEVQRLLALPEGWDSYRARAVDPWCVRTLLDLLLRTLPANAAPPRLDATSRGGVVALWHRDAIEIELEVPSRDRYRLLHVNGESEREVELPTTDLRPLVRAIDDLSRVA